MKRILSILLILFIMSVPAFAESDVTVYINDSLLQCDQPAIIFEGRTLVPLRAICEAIGCTVSWDAETYTAIIENDDYEIKAQIDNQKLSKRKKGGLTSKIEIDVPPMIVNDRTLLPARAISEAIGAEVLWNGDERRVDIYLDGVPTGELTPVQQGNKFGFQDSRGEMIVPAEYDAVGNFSEGFAFVEKKGKRGYINDKGKIAVQLKYEDAWDFCGGAAKVSKDGKYGFIDTQGNEITDIMYDTAENFSEGFAKISVNGKYGFVNTNGEMAIPAIYEDAGSFSDGLAMVSVGAKYGFINEWGEETIKIKYDDAGTFSEGLAWVSKDKKYGFVNTNGKEVISLKYDKAWSFKDGVAKVKKGSQWIEIDKNGRTLQCVVDF